MRTLGHLTLACLLAVLVAGAAFAQADPLGGEFQVNTYTSGVQGSASVAVAADGGFVVVWYSDGRDGSYGGIAGQRYAADGSAAGSEFLINTWTTFSQLEPEVGVDSDGDFVVVWYSEGGSSGMGQDGSSDSIQGQRYAADGSPVGGEFQVNTHTPNFQRRPSVAVHADGDFVVVWESIGQDGSDQSVHGQRYAADGSAAGGEFQVNTYTTSSQFIPAVATDADGNFVVVWQSRGQDGSGQGVHGQRYAADGSAAGGEFQVNTHTTGPQDRPAVAVAGDGAFVVVWQSFDQNRSIQGQRYAADGSAAGGEFQVGSYTTYPQYQPAVAASAGGDFVVTWTSYGQDGDIFGVFGQQFAADGSVVGGEFQVNTNTAGYQYLPAVGINASGDFVVAWMDGSGFASDGQDGSLSGIFAQRYEDEVTDTDGDGFPDDEDECPESDLSETVVIDGCDSGVTNYLFDNGCTISDLIAACADDAANHGQFVSCVSALTNELKRDGIISGRDKGKIQSCAAQANDDSDSDSDSN